MSRFVAVAVPVPALDLLTYGVPDGTPMPVAGARVDVPLGTRTLTGIAVIPGAAPPAEAVKVRDLLRVRDEAPFLPPAVAALAQWVSEYYLSGPGDAMATALPPRVLTGDQATFRAVRVVSLTAQGLDVASRLAEAAGDAPADGPKLGRSQREALLLLRGAASGLTAPALAARGIAASVVTRLTQLGLATVRREKIERDPFVSPGTVAGSIGDEPDRVHTAEQVAALHALRAMADGDAFQVALLHGVTGSGKTEIYLHLAEHVRRAGRPVLMLVPEIGLTPAVAARFRARFGERVAIQHSGLSDGERHDQWHRIRDGAVDVVVGTRSAVFAPLTRPGLIIVDEEHETSYKQEESPRYHGRDVAVMRGKMEGALVVLGSATPSLESYENAQTGRYALVRLRRRVLDRPLARVQVIDMRGEIAEAGAEVVLSRTLVDGLERRLERAEQSVVLLNRRGFATAVFCRQCGGSVECPNCSVSLTVHTVRGQWRARCHYCNHQRLVPKQCPTCAAPYLEHIGFGTERVEQEIRQVLPAARIGRVDRDTVGKRGSLTAMLDRFARRELDILVGTQMIAKGHDFPHVTLVGVISADVGLGLADFRAGERTFQLLTQVAGRSGRGETPGVAVIQTLYPDHYSIRLATHQDYEAYFVEEVAFRKAMRYPPLVAMVNTVVRGKTWDDAMDAAGELAMRTRKLSPGGFLVLGPAPAPLTRLRGEHRAQFFLKGTHRAAMRTALKQALASMPELARRVSVDVDPLSVL